ncbi:MAG TPA: hypothetical protein VM913_08885 [Sphingomicrobium sp.]|nr:hypothetical protein [Sphingomicrobium sp.]
MSLLSRPSNQSDPHLLRTAGLRRGLASAPVLFALAVLLQACTEAAPAGQVIAVVNGEEVTVAELNEEARARGLAIGSDVVLRKLLLQDVVDRKLLAQAAQQEELDRTPEYLLAIRRAQEVVLAQHLVAKATQEQAPVTPERLRALIAVNPQAFADRSLLTVEQLSFTPPARQQLRELTLSRTLAEAETKLAGLRIESHKSTESWDTATLDPASAQRLIAAGVGGPPVLLNIGGRVSLAKVQSASPRPVPPPDLQSYARQWLNNRVSQELAGQLLQQARESSHVRYQPEFGPGTPRP